MSTYFLKSKVREFVKQHGMKTAKDITHGKKLNGMIEEIIEDAVKRAKENGRKTVMERDL